VADPTPALPGFELGARRSRRRRRNEQERQRDTDRSRERYRRGNHWRTPKHCLRCSKEFIPKSGHQEYCGKDCAFPSTPKSTPIHYAECPAPTCGKTFIARQGRKTCSKACSYQYNKASIIARYHTDPAFKDQVLARSHARRASKLGLGGQQVLLSYLIERDKGRCQIPECQFRSRKVARLGTKGPGKPSIDHVVPLSRGGTHELSNVQLAHYRCNLEKHNSGSGEQLRLIG
jgi:5-methylcytosine-specific restriction endonuclease McrA